ncbi:hypothetical protein PoHVEF18_002378 [Penicillium ochrochloron]
MAAPIFRLPQELMSPIWDQLDNASRGCLALICNNAYEHFKPTFDHPFFNFSRPSCPLEDYPCPPGAYRAQMEYWYSWETAHFMQRIQTAQYIYCQSCCKLHPRSEFEELELQKSTNNKHCKWPGLIICREKDWSYPDLVSQLHDLSKLPGGFWPGLSCSVVSANASDRREALVEVLYYFNLNKDLVAPDPRNEIRICPHISLVDLVFRDRVLEEGKVESPVVCKECNAIAEISPDNNRDYVNYRITTRRKLRPSLSTQLSYQRPHEAQSEP